MKKFLLLLIAIAITPFSFSQTPCVNGFAGSYPCDGIDLMSFTPYIGTTDGLGAATLTLGGRPYQGNDSWGWTDVRDGKEYALVGLTNGLYFMDITNPVNPRRLGRLPKPSGVSNSLWSDVKTYENWAFIVSEAGNFGMQVFDLNSLQGLTEDATRVFNLTTVTTNNTYMRMTTIPGTGGAVLRDSHNIIINEDSGIAYILGSNLGLGGPIFIGIDTSTAPPTLTFEGNYSSEGYTHDAQVVTYDGPDPDYQGREILIGSNGNVGGSNNIVFSDLTDRITGAGTGAVKFISRIGYSQAAYAHQGWFTKDKKYFIFGDEEDEATTGVGNTKTIVLNVEDLDNPFIQFNYYGRTGAIDHNGYVKDKRFYMANYRAGMSIKRVHNIDNTIPASSSIFENGSNQPDNMVEESYFDSYIEETPNNNIFNGTWNVYPFFESGNILMTNLEGGVFIVKAQNYDNEAPVMDCTPIIATLNKASGILTLTADDLAAGATDNKGIIKKTILSGQTTFTCADVGNTFDITIEVEDDYGFKASCTRTITIEAEETQYTGGDIANNSSWSNGFPGLGSNARIASNATLTSATSIDACNCQVNTNRTLTIAADAYLKTEKDIVVNGNLVVAHQGSIVQTDDNAQVINNGSIDVEVITPVLQTRDFMIMGSPMDSETRNGVFATPFLVLDFDPSDFIPHPDVPLGGTNFADDDGNYYNQITGTTPILPAHGYVVRPQDSYTDPANETYTFNYTQGTLKNGVTTHTAYNNGPADNPNGTPNVLANPYSSAIDGDVFMTANGLTALYFWEHLTPPGTGLPGSNLRFDMDDISIRNLGMGMPAANDVGNAQGTAPNGVISTAQGFAIRTSGADGTTQEITFNNSMRLTSGNTTLGRTIPTESLVLEVRDPKFNAGGFTGIAFTANATNNLDEGYDTNRLATVVSLYSHLDDGSEELGIQSRAPFTEITEVTLGFSTQVESELFYEISIADIQGESLGISTVYLIDTQEDIITNLSEENYLFKSGKAKYDNRFILRFEPEEILGQDMNDENAIIVYPNPTNDIITINSPSYFIKDVEVYDVRGRRMSQSIEEKTNIFSINLAPLETSIYFVRITTEKGTVTKKIIKE